MDVPAVAIDVLPKRAVAQGGPARQRKRSNLGVSHTVSQSAVVTTRKSWWVVVWPSLNLFPTKLISVQGRVLACSGYPHDDRRLPSSSFLLLWSPPTEMRIEARLCPKSFFATSCIYPSFIPVTVKHEVHRADLAKLIMNPLMKGQNFVVVEGANRMGKTTVVEDVAKSLSSYCLVRRVLASSSSTGV